MAFIIWTQPCIHVNFHIKVSYVIVVTKYFGDIALFLQCMTEADSKCGDRLITSSDTVNVRN